MFPVAVRNHTAAKRLSKGLVTVTSHSNGLTPDRLRFGHMAGAALVSVEEYLASSFDPDCEYVEGRVLERNVGRRRHSHAQGYAYAWFWNRREALGLEPYVEQRIEVSPGKYRVPDLLLVRMPAPDEEVFTTPPLMCLEVMSPDDTMSSVQDRLDDFLAFGVPNVWVIDPWKGRAWTVNAAGWRTVVDGVLRTVDGEVGLPFAEILAG